MDKIDVWFQFRIKEENGKGAWFTSSNYDGLFYHDFVKGEVSIVGKVPDHKFKNALFGGGFKISDRLFLMPRYADKIAVYDVNTNLFLSMELPDASLYKIDFSKNFLGFIPIEYGEDIFLIYRCSPLVIRLNVNTLKMECIGCFESGESVRISADYLVADDCFYSTIADSNRLLSFDFTSSTLKVMHIGDENNRYFSVTKYGETDLFLLLEEKNTIYTWNKTDDRIKEFAKIDKIKYSTHQPLFFYNVADELYLIPLYDWLSDSNCICKIDTETKEILYINAFREFDGYIKFLVYKDCRHLGYFIAPYGEDIYDSASVQLLELHRDGGSFVVRKTSFCELIDEQIKNEAFNYQRCVKNSIKFDSIPDNVIPDERIGLSLADYLIYLQDNN